MNLNCDSISIKIFRNTQDKKNMWLILTNLLRIHSQPRKFGTMIKTLHQKSRINYSYFDKKTWHALTNHNLLKTENNCNKCLK